MYPDGSHRRLSRRDGNPEAQAGIDTLHIAQTSNGPLEYYGVGSGWRPEADTPDRGFIVVTPQGINNVWTQTRNDPQFFLDIVAETKKIANIATDKVYMTGISNGAMGDSQDKIRPNTAQIPWHRNLLMRLKGTPPPSYSLRIRESYWISSSSALHSPCSSHPYRAKRKPRWRPLPRTWHTAPAI